jgi:hypothetical protein
LQDIGAEGIAMESAPIGSALALASLLAGCPTPEAPPEEEVAEVCLGCVGLYPGSCLPAARCEPDLRFVVERVQHAENAVIEVREQ